MKRIAIPLAILLIASASVLINPFGKSYAQDRPNPGDVEVHYYQVKVLTYQPGPQTVLEIAFPWAVPYPGMTYRVRGQAELRALTAGLTALGCTYEIYEEP